MKRSKTTDEPHHSESSFSRSPVRVFVFIALTVFIAEAAVMLLLPSLPVLPYVAEAFTDASLLVLIISPALYYFLFRPLVIHIREREKIEGVLNKNQEEQFKVMIRTSLDGFWITDIEGRFLEVNDAYCTMMGYSRAELLNMQVADIEASETREDVTRHIGRLLAAGSEYFETRQRCRDGSIREMAVSANYNSLHGGRIYSFLRDITERKRMEVELQESEEKFRSMSAHTKDALVMMDDEGNINFWNAAAEKIFGYTSVEVMGKELHTLIAPEKYYEAFKKVYGHFRATGEGDMIGKTRELMALRKGGDEFPVELSLAALKLKDKWHGVGIVRDITERKALEHQSSQHNLHIKALINATSESSFLLDTDGVVLAINDTELERLNLTEADVMGKNLYDFIPAELAVRRRAVLLEAVNSRKPIRKEDERDGMKFLATYTPILDDTGKVVQVAVYAADVTERRQEQAIEQLLPAVNHKILEGVPFQDVLDLICETTVEAFDLALVWAGKKMEDGSIAHLAASGPAQGYLSALKQIGVRWDDTPLGRGPAGSAIRTAAMQYSPVGDVTFSPWARAAIEQGIGSSIAVPLMLRGKIYGVFVLYSKQATQFESPSVRNRIATLADKIRLAIEMANEQDQITLLSTALASAGNAVMITDPRGCIEWVNPAFVMLSGYSSAELMGLSPRILNSGKHDAEYFKVLWQTILAGQVWSGDTTEKHKNGALYTVQQTITPILNEQGEITHFVSIHEDVTAKLEAQARIQYVASHDGLTGLPNRSLFFDRMGQLFTLSKRNKTSLVLMFIDLDGFKQVNDKLGHHIGDLLLKGVADRLQACVRDSDTVARLGGDEFTVVLFDISGRENVANMAEKILGEMSRPFDLQGQQVAIGASIGIAITAHDRQISEDKLIERADTAMYEAKRAGKRCYRFASDE
jgi:diguanylate cyclase (GGDEF)-like protein/PAS domain S-box-containing protein